MRQILSIETKWRRVKVTFVAISAMLCGFFTEWMTVAALTPICTSRGFFLLESSPTCMGIAIMGAIPGVTLILLYFYSRGIAIEVKNPWSLLLGTSITMMLSATLALTSLGSLLDNDNQMRGWLLFAAPGITCMGATFLGSFPIKKAALYTAGLLCSIASEAFFTLLALKFIAVHFSIDGEKLDPVFYHILLGIGLLGAVLGAAAGILLMASLIKQPIRVLSLLPGAWSIAALAMLALLTALLGIVLPPDLIDPVLITLPFAPFISVTQIIEKGYILGPSIKEEDNLADK